MAEMREADKRILWGENYKEVLAKAQEEGRVQAAPKLLWAKQVDKCGNDKLSAVFIIVLGVVLLVSNFYAVSGPSVMLVSVFAAAALVVGVVWYVHIWRTLRKLRANIPPPDRDRIPPCRFPEVEDQSAYTPLWCAPPASGTSRLNCCRGFDPPAGRWSSVRV